jgi:Spy/CpxP family protein refolding chaperone
MKKRISIIAIIIAVAALAAAPLLLARPHRGGGQGGHGFGGGFAMFSHVERIKEELDLSDQQVEQIKSIMSAVHEQNAPYREQLHGGLHGIAATLLENPNNVAAAQALLDQQANAERALKTNFLNATAKALNVLNAGQREKLGTMLEKFAERRAEWHGRR